MRAFVEPASSPTTCTTPISRPGTAHFRTSLAEGQALMRELRGRISGLCQPTYVLDIPGGAGKVPIGPTYVEDDDLGEGVEVRGIDGTRHKYP